jgi:hypothetical protein
MSFAIDVKRGGTFTNQLGMLSGFDGVSIRKKSAKHPDHPFFEIGYFQLPPDDFSAALRRAVLDALDSIFELKKFHGRLLEPVPVRWTEAKYLVRTALTDFDTFSISVLPQIENDYYKQALEIIEETIDQVLKPGDNPDEYYLRCYGLDDPSLAPE